MQVVLKPSDLDRSSLALPGTWFRGHRRKAMSRFQGAVPDHESPRSHAHTRKQRLPLGPPKGKPSAIRGIGEWANSRSYGGREEKRRNQQGHARVNQAAVPASKRTLSARLNVSQLPPIRFENEVHKRFFASSQPVQSVQQDHLRPHLPRCLSRQPTMPVHSRQCLRTLQIELDASHQGGFCLLQGRAISGDIEIGADCVPLIATPSGITSEFHLLAPVPAYSSNTRKHSTTGGLPVPEQRLRFGGRG